MWLLIDDTRSLNVDAIARNAKSAKELLSLMCWDHVCFDYDLGEDESGYDVLKWAIQSCYLDNIHHVQLVTGNTVGRERMKNILEDNGYLTKDGCNFNRKLKEY
jgi:hypothetical protein